MPRAFADITFTEHVKAAQSRYGSREGNRAFEQAVDERNTLGEREKAFIETRDSFYWGTVGENGWPYVQHRGGPIGFLKVMDEKTIAFPDFRGNLQYISTGNLMGDGRVSLILMDYPQRRRLKLWGQARIVHESEQPALFARLELPDYRAPVERLVVIDIVAMDWNCPKHITPRFTEREVVSLLAPLQAEIARLNQILKDKGITDYEH